MYQVYHVYQESYYRTLIIILRFILRLDASVSPSNKWEKSWRCREKDQSRHRDITRKMRRSRNSLSQPRENPGVVEWLRARYSGYTVAIGGGRHESEGHKVECRYKKVNKEKVNENEEATGDEWKKYSRRGWKRKTTIKTRVGEKEKKNIYGDGGAREVEEKKGDGVARGDDDEWKRGEKKKRRRKPRLVIWIGSTIHSKPRALVAADPPLYAPFVKIWILLDLSRP